MNLQKKKIKLEVSIQIYIILDKKIHYLILESNII